MRRNSGGAREIYGGRFSCGALLANGGLIERGCCCGTSFCSAPVRIASFRFAAAPRRYSLDGENRLDERIDLLGWRSENLKRYFNLARFSLWRDYAA